MAEADGEGRRADDTRPPSAAAAVEERAERAASIRRYARARSADNGIFVVAFGLAFALGCQFADPLALFLVFLPALLSEAGERLMLHRTAAMPDQRVLSGETRWRIRSIGAINTAVTALCLWMLWRLWGQDGGALASALCLCLSVYTAIVHAAQPRLHTIRQVLFLVAFAGVHGGEVLHQWPDPSTHVIINATASAMLGAMLVVIYLNLDRKNRRRSETLRALRAARREAEQRSRMLERVRDSAERAALHDALTGLPNRRYLERMLDALRVGGGDGPELEIAMLLIDLDRFKAINDTLGHDAGDTVLRRMSQILRDNVREGDFVARIGGDEFVVLVPDEVESRAAESLAARLIAAARVPLPYGDQLCRFGASIGIARAPRRDARPEQLLINADIALYRAKARGRGRAEQFSEALHEEVVAAKRLGDDILRGLEAGEFAPFYQPLVHASDRSVAAVEAVARWLHPERGVLGPGDFLVVAAEIGALAEIDGVILRRALADRAMLAAQGIAPPPLSVNVSAARLAEPDLAAEIEAACLPPGALSFELGDAADSAAADERVRWTLDRLAELGVEIEIDDFGAGPASIATLDTLRPRRLKIDRSFIAPMMESSGRHALVAALVDVAHSLGLGVVAEGVETEAQARALHAMGCERLQGFAFAPPLSARGLAEWLRQSAERTAHGSLTPDEPACIRTARK